MATHWLELDLHFLSLGGGEVALQWWFEECLVPYFQSEKLAAVKTVHIVTGYGKTRWRGAREGDDGMRKRIGAMLSFMNIHEFEQPNKGRIHIDKALLEQEVARNNGRIIFDAEGYNKWKAEQTTANQVPSVEQIVRPRNLPTRTGEVRPRMNQDRYPRNNRGGFGGRGRGRGGPGRGYYDGGRGGGPPGRQFDGPNRDYQGGRQGGPGGQYDGEGRGYYRQQSDSGRYGGPPGESGGGRDANYAPSNDRYSGGRDDRQGYGRKNDRYGDNSYAQQSYGQQSYGSQSNNSNDYQSNNRSNDYHSHDRSYGNDNQDRGSYQGGYGNDNDGYNSRPPAASRGYHDGRSQGYASRGDSNYGPGSQRDDRHSSYGGDGGDSQSHYGPDSHGGSVGGDRKRPYDESFQQNRGYDQGGSSQQYKRQARY